MKHGEFTINEPYAKTPYDRVANLTFYYMRNKTKKMEKMLWWDIQRK